MKEVYKFPKIFADTSNKEEIMFLNDFGIIQGITTNPIIVANQVGEEAPYKYYEQLAHSFHGLPISIQLLNSDIPTLIQQSVDYAKISPDIVIKVPMFGDGKGLSVLANLAAKGIKTNVTGLMKKEQLLLALIAGKNQNNNGPNYVSLFFNRIKDSKLSPDYNDKIHGSGNPKKEIKSARKIITKLGLSTEIISGSIRCGDDVFQAILAGTHIVTVQPKVILDMIKHYKTEEFIKECEEKFIEDISKR